MCFKKNIFFFLSFFLFFSIAFAKEENNQRIAIHRAFNGELETHMSGVSTSSPPYIKIIRSEDGLEHLFKDFNRIKQYATHKKLRWLKQYLKKVDLETYMLIAILTAPVDNYDMEFNGLYKRGEERLEVNISYQHKDDVSYSLTPVKKIYYKILAVQKNNLPVVLKAENTFRREGKKSKRPLRYISGRLFAGKKDELRLISPRPRKGTIYYIRGDWASKLKEHTGKTVTLRGRISDRPEGLYELNFEVDKLVKFKK